MEAKDHQSKKKSRLKWTKELHDCFVKAVNQLGGAYEATPKDIVEIMGIKGITTDHVKSYLQKYRLNKDVYGRAYAKAVWNGNVSEAIQENEQRRNLARQEEYIQPRYGKSPVTYEGQTNFYNESEVNSATTISRQKLQADTNRQPPVHPISSGLTLSTNQTAATKAHCAYTSSVNEAESNKFQVLQTAKTKSAWLLAPTSKEDKGLLSWPSASMRDVIFGGSTMTKYQNYHDLTSSSTGLQRDKYFSNETKLDKTYEPIDLNVSAQDMVQKGKRIL